jgi:hypothetical protein
MKSPFNYYVPYQSHVSLVGNQPNLTFDQLCNALKNEEAVLGVTSSNSMTTFYGNYKTNNTKKPCKT